VIVVVLAGAPGRVDRGLTCAERVHMPFPRVAGLFVGSERWSGLGCLLQVRVRLRTALPKCVAVCPENSMSSLVHCSPVEYFVLDVGARRISCLKVHSSGT
jgi:hypothetical protein